MKTKAFAQNQFVLPLMAIAAIAVLAFLLPQAGGVAKGFVKLFFEGNSFGKTLTFFVFEIAFLAILAVAARMKWKPKRDPKFYLKVFFACIALLWVAGYGAEYWLFAQQGAGIDSYVGALYPAGGANLWEATYLQHNHVNKVAVAELFSLFGLQKSASVDTGLPLYAIFPFAGKLGIVVLGLVAVLLASGLLFSLSRFRKPERWFWLWNLVFFAGFTQAIDGGLFSMVGINFAGLGAILLAREFWAKRKTHKYLDTGFGRLVLLPLLVMLGIALVLQGLAGTWFFENHGAIVLLVGLALLALEGRRKRFFLVPVAAIAIAVLLLPWVSGTIPQGASEVFVFPSIGASAREWNSAFAGVLEVRSAQNYGNFAVLTITAPRPLTAEQLKQVLESKFRGRYFDVEPARGKSVYEVSLPAQETGKFRSLSSREFKTVLVRAGGQLGKVVIEARSSELMALLFALNLKQAGAWQNASALSIRKLR